jgi:hypothetical protein
MCGCELMVHALVGWPVFPTSVPNDSARMKFQGTESRQTEKREAGGLVCLLRVVVRKRRTRKAILLFASVEGNAYLNELPQTRYVW